MRVHTTWGLRAIGAALSRPDAVTLDASDMELDGFVDDTRSEYRQRSVTRTEVGGSISLLAPACGDRYVGFVIYDESRGAEPVDIEIDGVVVATAIADANNRRERLFTLSESRRFEGGERVRLVAHGASGRYRIERVAFLTELPEATERPFEIRRLHVGAAEESASASSVEARITWTTTRDASCRVEYWGDGSNGRAIVEEDELGMNHRVVLRGLETDAAYRYRVVSTDIDGATTQSEVGTFSTRAAAAPAGSVRSAHVPLTVTHEGTPSYPSAPVTHGVPFPEGVLGASDHLRLCDPAGAEVTLQASTLGRWLDGSAKWALLDFHADTAAGQSAPYTLEYGADVRRGADESPLTVDESDDTLTIDAGPLTVVVDRSHFAPFSEIRVAGRALITGSRLVVTDVDGAVFTSTRVAVTTVEVEDRGPVRCAVRIEGRHADEHGVELFTSICRLHVYAGQPYVRLDHTFVCDASSETFIDIASMTLEIDTPESDTDGMHVFQTHDDARVVDGEEREGRCDGRFRVGGLDVVVPDFWQSYPKSFRALPGRVDLGICPSLDGVHYSEEGEDEHKLYFYLKHGRYRFREGVAKTHTVYLGADVPPLPLPTVQAPAEWYCDSGALGEMTPAGSGRFGVYEAKVAQALDGYRANREAGSEYGMLNYGDWWGERRWNWGNSEYDTAYGFFLQWARSGDPGWFAEAALAALHHRDVDVCHASADAGRVDGVYTHCIGHTGGYYPDGYRPGAITRASFSVSHTWVDGFLLHHFLTGDRRSMAVARRIADRYDADGTRNYDFTNCRSNGWHLILTMAMYHATRDRFYLNAGHLIVERTLERQTDDGGWRRMMVPGHCYHEPPRHTGNAGFMVGILLAGLKLYHQATGDAAVADAIVRGAEFLIDDMWVDDSDGFRYTSCPESSLCTDNFHRGIDGIGYAWRISGSEVCAEILPRATEMAIDRLSPSGKSISASLRHAPSVLRDVARLLDGRVD
ncbi:fibronectin type III domain-containing protein [Candidatus Poribacteria bacterium]|nr:fibronectin type III domain-containing protein [Candidatus Poribacteria bacterium]MBT5536316.1 fibronectin type III domain-containing protein [Candidatus Poribacteria bacterium]MBT5712554.1 fibronectin type III domain-containing protein [Candidatus Poribacteria bacterium]MBT7808802.1 fibronectin type III domain-containing protein [Candidatus Poribacteria bacterium]